MSSVTFFTKEFSMSNVETVSVTSAALSEALDNLLAIKAQLAEARAKAAAERRAEAKASAKAKAEKIRAVKAEIRALMKAHGIKVEDLIAETVH
jgi:DNA-binding protein H-NS